MNEQITNIDKLEYARLEQQSNLMTHEGKLRPCTPVLKSHVKRVMLKSHAVMATTCKGLEVVQWPWRSAKSKRSAWRSSSAHAQCVCCCSTPVVRCTGRLLLPTIVPKRSMNGEWRLSTGCSCRVLHDLWTTRIVVCSTTTQSIRDIWGCPLDENWSAGLV